MTRRYLVTAATFLFVGTARLDADDERITVRLTDGRVFSGRVDGRTGPSALWLRFGGDAITVRRAFDWTEIDDAAVRGERVRAADLRPITEALAARESNARPGTAGTVQIEPESIGPGVAPLGAERRAPARVRGFTADGTLANWDADVEPDGIVVRVIPFGDRGEPVRAEGTLDVRLAAPVRVAYDAARRARGETMTQIGNWTRRITAREYDADDVEFALGFGARDPNADATIGSHGMLEVRLIVPGHGVFERRVEPLRIRPYSPLRDRNAFR
ncbi:MAG: hypothetical protein FJ297_07040 [Planctomycetes bacterium]|nr:hypothetical protein [Planctomycetota bacterium]